MASTSPRWQLRVTMDTDAVEVMPVPNGACILRSASMPPEAGVWVGILADSPFGEMQPFSVNIAMHPSGQLALKTSPLLRQPGDELAAGGEEALVALREALRDDLPGASTALAGDTIFVLGAGRRGGELDDTPLWAIRDALTFAKEPRVERVSPRAAPGERAAPGRRVLPALAGHDGALYIVGGGLPVAPAARQPLHAADGELEDDLGLVEKLPAASAWDCWKFTPDDVLAPGAGGAWSEVPLRGAAPHGGGGLCGAASVVMPGGQLLLFGGQTLEGFTAEVLGVDVTTGVVTLLSDASAQSSPRPSARARASAVLLADGRHVLLVGGGTDTRDARDAWLFDVPLRRWEEVNIDGLGPPDVPEPPPHGPATEVYGMARTVFGRHTLLMTLPTPRGRNGAATFTILEWGGVFAVRAVDAKAGQCLPLYLNGMCCFEINPAAVLTSAGCAACGAKNPTSQCSRCFAARYCNAVCQRAHWSEHRKTCAPKK